MLITAQNLAKLDREFSGYLEGGAVTDFLRAFGIRFAAGHWCAGGFSDRFAVGGYNPGLDETPEAQLERVAAVGVEGVELHDSLFLDRERRRDPAKIKRLKQRLENLELIPTNMNTNLWTDPYWKLGGLTNPDPGIRREALAVLIQSAEIAAEIGCTSVALWPGSDGWDYNFEADYGQLLDWFLEGCAAVSRRAAGLGLDFGLEAKLKEPREGNMIVPTTHFAILVARQINEATGGKNMGVAVDYGHEMMTGVEPAFNLYAAARFGVPVVNFHVNSAKWRSNDEDRITGTANLWQMVDFCHAAVDTGYQGWFGEDQFTYRVDPVRAMTLSRELFANCMKKALLIWRKKDRLAAVRAGGDAALVIDQIKRDIFNG